MSRTHRLWHLGPVAGTAAHHGFELAAGVGLVFQPYLGLAGSAAAWSVALPGWVVLTFLAGRRDRLARRRGAADGTGGVPLVPGAEPEPAGAGDLPSTSAKHSAPADLSPADGALAFLAGVSLAGALVHFAIWPVGRRPAARRWGVPVLTSAEGLRASQLPPYNGILYAWAAASLVALVRGTPRGARRYALAGFASWVPLRRSAEHHFRWLAGAAAAQPAWWNRAARDRT